MGGNRCKPKLSDRCGSPINLKCTDYEGMLLSNTTLDEDDCITGEGIIEDIINQVDENTEDLDFVKFASCLEIDPSDSDRGLTIADVISAHDSEICRLKGVLEDFSNPDEPCEDDCCEDDGCCQILKKFDAYTSPIVTADGSDWNITTTSNLMYKATKTGTYKFTFELGCSDTNLATSTMNAGLSLNSFSPGSSLFEQVEVSGVDNITITFIKKMIPNDEARFANMIGTGIFTLDYVKMVVEKVR